MKEESPFTHLCSQLKLSEHDMHVVAFSLQMGDFNASQMDRYILRVQILSQDKVVVEWSLLLSLTTRSTW